MVGSTSPKSTSFRKEITYGGLNDPEGKSGLARDRPRWRRQSLNRFRRARSDAVFFQGSLREREGYQPEELIAAAHAGCFTMALAFGMQAGDYTPTELTTEAAVTLEPEGQGFRITNWERHLCTKGEKPREQRLSR